VVLLSRERIIHALNTAYVRMEKDLFVGYLKDISEHAVRCDAV
jgi:hypothetical protein